MSLFEVPKGNIKKLDRHKKMYRLAKWGILCLTKEQGILLWITNIEVQVHVFSVLYINTATRNYFPCGHYWACPPNTHNSTALLFMYHEWKKKITQWTRFCTSIWLNFGRCWLLYSWYKRNASQISTQGSRYDPITSITTHCGKYAHRIINYSLYTF